MQNLNTGLLPKSVIHYSSPSQAAKKLFYFPISAGHYYCNKEYVIKRNSYNRFMIIHILNGSCKFNTPTGSFQASKGKTVILNTFEPHEYSSCGKIDFLWVYFDGQNSMDLYTEITNSYGSVIDCLDKEKVASIIGNIIHFCSLPEKFSESQMSLEIYSLLCELFNPIQENNKSNSAYTENVNIAKKYIEENLAAGLTVAGIANSVHMSASHFSRIFRKQTGVSPYEYVLISRLRKAKHYLQNTNMPITDIAFETGFNSESNFIYFFTNNMGMSPNKFRKSFF